MEIAAKIGYPVMIKAAAGGGGRGIRPVHNEASLRSELSQRRGQGRGRVQGRHALPWRTPDPAAAGTSRRGSSATRTAT